MNFAAFVARRYLFAKKSANVINIISGISIVGVATGTMALIIILSVYNGFEDIIQKSFSKFDPDLKITAVKGKVFSPDENIYKNLYAIQGIEYVCPTLEENVLLEYEDKMAPAVIKGVSPEFAQMNHIDSVITLGQFLLKQNNLNYGVPGTVLARTLGINTNFLSAIKIYVPKRTAKPNVNPRNAFNTSYVSPSGIFEIQMDYDGKYLLADLGFTRNLLEYGKEVSALEVGIEPSADIENIQEKVETLLGNGFKVQNQYQQQEVLFRVMKSERWAIFMILSFIIVIAAFNIIGSVSMLIIEKKDDIKTLNNLGLTRKGLERIFAYEGWMISLFGCVIGLVLGTALTLVQQYFGIVKVGNLIVDAYPVSFKPFDVIIVAGIVVAIGYLMSKLPVGYFIKRYDVR
jgi:lipoprotein-releasing system permease protein